MSRRLPGSALRSTSARMGELGQDDDDAALRKLDVERCVNLGGLSSSRTDTLHREDRIRGLKVGRAVGGRR